MALPLILGTIVEVIGKIIPDPQKAADAKIKLFELAQAGDLKELDANLQLALQQIELNKVEAAQPGLFKGGWRPATGWICTCGLAYTFIARPLLPWFMALGGATVPPLPPIDMTELFVLLGGLLGLGGMRSFERAKGKA